MITNGGYTQISHAGSGNVSVLHLARSIGLDFNSGNYLISGAYPVSGVGGIGIPGQIYAIIQLSFFVVAVQVGETDLPNPWPSQSSVFTTTGASLSSLTGVGKMVDQQANNSGEPSYYINEVDASSTAKVTRRRSRHFLSQ